MKDLKNILFVLLLIPIIGCQLEGFEEQPPILHSVGFEILDGLAGVPGEESDMGIPDYALVIIAGEEGSQSYYLNAVQDSGTIVLEELQLHEGEYTLQEFILFDDFGTVDNRNDDIMISASPHAGSFYGEMTVRPLDLDFAVTRVPDQDLVVDVFRYDPLKGKRRWYGFLWFQPNVIVFEQALYFGDLCSHQFEIYQGSLYGDYPKIDMPAIFEIHLYQDTKEDGSYTELINKFSNEDDYEGFNDGGTIKPLSVLSSNFTGTDEHYKMEVYVYMVEDYTEDTQEYTYSYQHVADWYYSNSPTSLYANPLYRQNVTGVENYTPGDDGIYDFMIGPCVASFGDIIL